MGEQLGTENIEKLLESAAKIAVIVKKVKEDGKVDKNDLAHLTPLIADFKLHVEAFAGAKEALAEIKDLDVAEVVALITKVDAMVDTVEQA